MRRLAVRWGIQAGSQCLSSFSSSRLSSRRVLQSGNMNMGRGQTGGNEGCQALLMQYDSDKH